MKKRFEDFKKQRNKVKSLVRSAKKSYFDKLIELDKSTTTIWKAINEITNKSFKKIQIKKTAPLQPFALTYSTLIF